ncbi:MAG: adenosylmethionine--8-amino-7-oxononanoate transaminase [Myxococcota bacterium]|nr:adenosylmethionine--8-amino-7-oxononanoate transaminase [Myxococcota bacterium]
MDRARIVELDKRRVWHPYTAMDAYREATDPIVVERAEGPFLFEADGRRYIDANASWWVAALGHNHPRLVDALTRQARRNCHSALAGMTHREAAELGERLCEVAPPGLEVVFYSDDGSTAVEVGLKVALQYWAQNGRPERNRFVSFTDAFHGETLGVTSVGGVELFRRPFAGAVREHLFAPSPWRAGGAEAARAALAALLERHADEVAAVVMEPVVQGAAGMRISDPAFVRAARELCDAHDVLLILDEVFTGYGRTGPMWACEHAGVSPDVLCTAKGFSGGMLPMAATLLTARLEEGFRGGAERAFYYGHSFCGNPLGAAVALEVLRVYEEERILERAKAKAERIARAFDGMAAIPGVAHARALGMVAALDLEGDAGYLARAGWGVYEAARARGAYLRPLGNVVYVTPPLNIPDDVLDELLGIVRESVEEAVAAG